MSKQTFYTKLKEDKDNNQWWVDCGIIEKGKHKTGATFKIDEPGTIAFHKDRNTCLINAAEAMIKEANRLLGMVK